MSVRELMVTFDQLSDGLNSNTLEPIGRLVDSSNNALMCSLNGIKVVYKPQRLEAPLWDFAEGTLGRREVAVSEIDRFLGWDLVPPTIWWESAPVGPGSVQVFIEGAQISDVGLFEEGQIPDGWFYLFTGELEGQEVHVAHANSPDLMKLAVFDAVINNADRKGGHLLRDHASRLWAIDHGVSLHEEPKLRTVLWGWAQSPLQPDIAEDLMRLASELETLELEGISQAEREALLSRVTRVLSHGLPLPSRRWPAIPWPVF